MPRYWHIYTVSLLLHFIHTLQRYCIHSVLSLFSAFTTVLSGYLLYIVSDALCDCPLYRRCGAVSTTQCCCCAVFKRRRLSLSLCIPAPHSVAAAISPTEYLLMVQQSLTIKTYFFHTGYSALKKFPWLVIRTADSFLFP